MTVSDPAAGGRSASPPGFEVIGPAPHERTQLIDQLTAAFELTTAAATLWVDSIKPGRYFARRVGETIAASFAVDLLELRRGAEFEGDGVIAGAEWRSVAAHSLASASTSAPGFDTHSMRAVMLQSVCVDPAFRGQGFGLTRDVLADLLPRFAADVVILSLFEDDLVQYWAARGFALEYRSETVSLEECLRRSRASWAPVPEMRFVTEKIDESEADGEEALLRDGLLTIRRPGADAFSELLIVDADAAESALGLRRDTPVALKTIMTFPASIGLFAPFNV